MPHPKPLLKGHIPKNKRKWNLNDKNKFIYIFKVDLNLRNVNKQNNKNNNIPNFYIVKVGMVMAGYDALVRRLITHKNSWKKQNILVSIPFNSDSIVDKKRIEIFKDLCAIIYFKDINNNSLSDYEKYISSFLGLPFPSNVMIELYGKEITPSEFILMEVSLFNKIRDIFLKSKLFMSINDFKKVNTGLMCVKEVSFTLEHKWIDTHVKYFAKLPEKDNYIIPLNKNKNVVNKDGIKIKNDDDNKNNKDNITSKKNDNNNTTMINNSNIRQNEIKTLDNISNNDNTYNTDNNNNNIKNFINNKSIKTSDVDIIMNTPVNFYKLIKNDYDPAKKNKLIDSHSVKNLSPSIKLINPAFDYECTLYKNEEGLEYCNSMYIKNENVSNSENACELQNKKSYGSGYDLLNDFLELKEELSTYFKNESIDIKKNNINVKNDNKKEDNIIEINDDNNQVKNIDIKISNKINYNINDCNNNINNIDNIKNNHNTYNINNKNNLNDINKIDDIDDNNNNDSIIIKKKNSIKDNDDNNHIIGEYIKFYNDNVNETNNDKYINNILTKEKINDQKIDYKVIKNINNNSIKKENYNISSIMKRKKEKDYINIWIFIYIYITIVFIILSYPQQ